MKPFNPAAAVLIAGISASAMPAQAQIAADLPPSAVLLVRFDADKDGAITRAEMEAGLKQDYAEADLDHNNCLNAPEVRAENERRLRREGGQATPLVDWNVDGCVNMQEFAATTRSYFTFADRSKDGNVSNAELRGPSMPLPYPTIDPRNPPPPRQGQNPSTQPANPGVIY
jgi:hypothetical protein